MGNKKDIFRKYWYVGTDFTKSIENKVTFWSPGDGYPYSEYMNQFSPNLSLLDDFSLQIEKKIFEKIEQ